jgi:hypothetical protein
VGLIVVVGWVMLCSFTSLLFMAGGALGAKFSKQRAS